MNSCFIILAGGESKRFNSNIPKPYTDYNGKPLLLHSINKAKIFNKFNKIVLVINKKHKIYIRKLNIKNISIINGGNTRAQSAYIGLKSIKKNNFKKLLSINVKKVTKPENKVIKNIKIIIIFFLIKSIIVNKKMCYIFLS